MECDICQTELFYVRLPGSNRALRQVKTDKLARRQLEGHSDDVTAHAATQFEQTTPVNRRGVYSTEKGDSRQPIRVGLRKYRRRIQNFIVRSVSASGILHTPIKWDSEIALDKPKRILSADDRIITSMIVAEELLKPISDELPCGEDLSYDPGLQELETLARGKPETQFSAAEPPNWKELRSRCLELFDRSKDLRVAMTLAVASLELDGLPGFRESLSLVKGLLERYWTTVYPQLDPADDNDPLQRMNIVASMAMPVGTYGDSFRILERLRGMPLCDSVQMGRYSLADILRAESGAPSAGRQTRS